jgi:SAM-dependent methyltransferase
MKEALLRILCEPVTGADLELLASEERKGEIWQGRLRSVVTGKEYPIRAGIPRFVDNDGYTASFGLQWNRYSRIQLDSTNGASYSRRRFEREVGWSERQLAGQWVLDAGCGCGRFAEIAAQFGAEVVAMDYSTAVDAAARNLGMHPNVHFVQGDLLEPPVRPGSLAFAYSLGVFQHTADSRASMTAVLRLLMPGGQFAFTIYGRRWYTRLYGKYLLRKITRGMPPAVLLGGIEACMPVMFPLTHALFSVPVFGKFAQFAIPVANYVKKTDFSRAQRYQEAILDTFDMLSPAFDNPMTAAEAQSVLEGAGVREFSFLRTVPINLVGTLSSKSDRSQAKVNGSAPWA